MSFTEKIPITTEDAYLWYVYPEKITDANMLRSCFEILSDDEKKQQQRFVFEKDRHLYLVAHALMRTSLSRYADVSPEDWIFKKNKYGKPEIEYPAIAMPITFNLSHTKGLLACLITLRHSVGVDVENMAWDDGGRMGIAENYFSSDEVQNLLSLPLNEQRKRFYEFWTLKEAYIKAKGMGLSIPLDKFSFQLYDQDRISISFNGDLYDNPERWRFYLNELTQHHMCAAAIECGNIPIKIVVKEDELFI